MTQLTLFPCEAGERLGTIRRGRVTLSLSIGLRTPPDPPPGPRDSLGMAMADAPTGVVDFPRPPAGDPAWERFGLIVMDMPRAHRRGLAAHHRRAGER